MIFLDYQSNLWVYGSKMDLVHPSREGQRQQLVNQVNYLDKKSSVEKVKNGFA